MKNPSFIEMVHVEFMLGRFDKRPLAPSPFGRGLG
jgi:hypothetical protein